MSQNTYIDLTSSSPTGDSNQRLREMLARRGSSQHSFASSQEPPPKRRRIDSGSVAGPSSQLPPQSRHDQLSNRSHTPDLEEIDLTEGPAETALAHVLAKQREDAVKAQHLTEDSAGRTSLTAYKCPVCMDVTEDATTTICGHLFCHKCIIETLRFGEERRAMDGSGKTLRGNCPVCRKQLSRVDIPGPKRNLVPLQLKLTTKKRS
ncbi:hypothetical protein AJ80_06932 [Polytolypa hystricis UAMH7299]|uniref:RING-type domain-containing protein n=1 Tax=Polytolypa hystricis (strain UAMH7299) TaxID=1447883 RepID=A0A2B7XTQ5_POLH7|nr:hypothetical protein AJ80_06932 [Polytolypa hystricis UAMH7299]